MTNTFANVVELRFVQRIVVVLFVLAGLSVTHALAQSGAALSFDGSDDYVDLNNISQLNNATSFTLEGWVKPTNFSAIRTIFSKGTSATDIIALDIDFDGKLVFRIGSTTTVGTTNGALSANTWQHVAAVFNGYGATNADRCKIYINGVKNKSDKNKFVNERIEFIKSILNTQSDNANYFICFVDHPRYWKNNDVFVKILAI